ncbi:MAG TPA: GNAT family N-acetyltransferase [Bacteroidales bacterium]|nr:GNAT family N-acetyltransferase [Bacteroidales bacterium]
MDSHLITMPEYPEGKLLTLADAEEWRAAFRRLPVFRQDVYFTPEYYRLFEAWQGGRAACFVFTHAGDTALYPFLMNPVPGSFGDEYRNYIDIQGAYGYNGVASGNDTEEFSQRFYAKFHDWCLSNGVIAEFTRFNPVLDNIGFSRRVMEVEEDRTTVLLPLPPGTTMESVRTGYRKETRKNVKHALVSPITWRKGSESADYKSFGSLYRYAMQHRGAAPFYLFDDSFFERLRSTPKDLVHLLLFEVDGEFAGGFLLFTGGLYAHNFLSAVNDTGRRAGISELMQDVAVAVTLEQGCTMLHLGGGSTRDPYDSLLKFKKGFSGHTARFYIGKKIHNPVVYCEVMEAWKQKYPALASRIGHRLLAYRERE